MKKEDMEALAAWTKERLKPRPAKIPWTIHNAPRNPYGMNRKEFRGTVSQARRRLRLAKRLAKSGRRLFEENTETSS